VKKAMKSILKIMILFFLLTFSAGCASLSFNPKGDEGPGMGSSWGSDEYRNEDWIDMYGH
jgi:hypothetical protein